MGLSRITAPTHSTVLHSTVLHPLYSAPIHSTVLHPLYSAPTHSTVLYPLHSTPPTLQCSTHSTVLHPLPHNLPGDLPLIHQYGQSSSKHFQKQHFTSNTSKVHNIHIRLSTKALSLRVEYWVRLANPSSPQQTCSN